MPSTYSALLRLTKQTDGENSGTWGDIVNTQFLQLIEDSVANTAVINAAGGTYNLTVGFGASDQSRCAVLNCNAVLTSNLTLIAPSSSKIYLLANNTSGAFTLSINTASGTPLNIAQGTMSFVYCDGTNFHSITSTGSVTLQGTATGNIDMAGYIFDHADLKRYKESVYNAGIVNGAFALDYSNGNWQEMVLNGNASFSLSNWPASGVGGSMLIKIVQDATGGRVLTLPSAFKALGGTPLSLSTAANAIDYMVVFSDDGATYNYNILQNFA